jgi:DNA-binding response OmpR family regulator/predicted Ser/Thr protein kinase
MTEEPVEHGGLRVLVVDDDPAVRLLLRRMLERKGFEVSVAESGAAALLATQGQDFDLVITDLSMPGMSGLDFMREARGGGLRSPVIFLTATGSVNKAVEAIKGGAFEFMEKPLRSDELGKVIEAALASRGEAPRSHSLDLDMDPAVTVDGLAGGSDATRPRDQGSLSLNIEVEDPVRRRPPPAPGRRIERIGRYEVVDRIGKGGMGVVFRCRDPLIGRTVAVKVLHAFADAPEHEKEMSARFRREAAAAGTLAHPGIVAIHDLGYDQDLGDWFIVMELIDGTGLHLALREGERLEPEKVARLGFQVADALAFAHAHGVVHRDVKPSNVIVQPDGTARLLDFGLAAVEGWDVTISGRVFGSPSYMAPERIRGNPGGPAGDQFSLGVVLYEVASGQNPFDAGNPEARLRKVLRHHPEPLASAVPSVPEVLSDAIGTMMSKQESGRFPSMDAVADAFLGIGRDMGIVLERHPAARE